MYIYIYRAEELQIELEKSRSELALLEKQLEMCGGKTIVTHSQHAGNVFVSVFTNYAFKK